MEAAPLQLIHYRSNALGRSVFPGAHPSRLSGQGFVFRENESFIRAMDPRRIDIHATLRNPMGDIMVRTFNQKSSTSIHVIADLSASIATGSNLDKLAFTRELARSLAFSARVYGDRFGFTGCNDSIDTACLMPQSRDIGGINTLTTNLQSHCLKGTSAALPEAYVHLGTRQSIVFLVSDFLFPRALLGETLDSLTRHNVVPVVVGKMQTLPGNIKRGLVSLFDSETGSRRKVFVRPGLVKQYRARSAEYYADLSRFFDSRNLRPLFVDKAFDADEISQYFHS